MRSRGFTLIELMIALAIMAMLAGIVLPIGISRLNASSFSQTQRQLESAVGIARADAQRRGRLLKLVAIDSGGSVAIWSIERGSTETGAEAGRREFVMELPAGASIIPAPAANAEDADSDAEEDEWESARSDDVRRRAEGAGEDSAERALCVLMPDGTVSPGETLVLRGRGGAMARMDFNPWTGMITFVPVRPVESASDDVPAAPEDRP